MPFLITGEPDVLPNPIAEAGDSFNLSFELTALGENTLVAISYTIRPAQPYVFVPPTTPADPKLVGPEPRMVSTAGTVVPRPLTVKKTSATPPKVLILFIDVEVVEVDEDGHVLTLPGGMPAPPQNLTAVVNLA
jgi:hypothetical protein